MLFVFIYHHLWKFFYACVSLFSWKLTHDEFATALLVYMTAGTVMQGKKVLRGEGPEDIQFWMLMWSVITFSFASYWLYDPEAHVAGNVILNGAFPSLTLITGCMLAKRGGSWPKLDRYDYFCFALVALSLFYWAATGDNKGSYTTFQGVAFLAYGKKLHALAWVHEKNVEPYAFWVMTASTNTLGLIPAIRHSDGLAYKFLLRATGLPILVLALMVFLDLGWTQRARSWLRGEIYGLSQRSAPHRSFLSWGSE